MEKIIDLKNKKCVSCEGGVPVLDRNVALGLQKQTPLWKISLDNKEIYRDFKFKDFVEAMAFVNKVAKISESEGHHPDISISWNKVHLDLTTHAIGGLSENDFILAVKVDVLYS